MDLGVLSILLFQHLHCTAQIGGFLESLINPGIVCQGQKTTLFCYLNRTSLVWKYSNQFIGIPISSPDQSYTITIGLLGHFFDKSVYSRKDGHLQSSLSFAANLDMNGTKVKCEGPHISLSWTIHILPQGVLPNVSSPEVLDVAPGTNAYATILRWNVTGGTKHPTVRLEPPLPHRSHFSINSSHSMVTINITAAYSVRYLINISSQNCNGRMSRKYELYKAGYCDQPPNPPLHGVIDPIKDRYSQGEVVHYYCSKEDKKQYRQTTCTLEGTWTPDPSVLNCKITATKKWFIGLVAALGLLATIFLVATISFCIICKCGKHKKTSSRRSSPSIPGSRGSKAASRLTQNAEQDSRYLFIPESIPKLQVESPSTVPVIADVLEESHTAGIQESPIAGEQVDADSNIDYDDDDDRILHLTVKGHSKQVVEAEVTPLEVMSIENSTNEIIEEQQHCPEGVEDAVTEGTDNQQPSNKEEKRDPQQPTEETEQQQILQRKSSEVTTENIQQQPIDDSKGNYSTFPQPAGEGMSSANAQLATGQAKAGQLTYQIEVKVHTESGATIQAETLPAKKESYEGDSGLPGSETLAMEEGRKSVASMLGSQDSQKENSKMRDHMEDNIELHDMIQEKPGRSEEDDTNIKTGRRHKSTSTSHSSKGDDEQEDMLVATEEVEQGNKEQAADTERSGQDTDIMPTQKSSKPDATDNEVLDSSPHKEPAGLKGSKEQDVSTSPKPVKHAKSGTKHRQDSKIKGISSERFSGQKDHPPTGNEEDSEATSKKISPKGKRIKKKGLAQDSKLLSSEASGSSAKIVKKTSGKQRGRSLHKMDKNSTPALHGTSPPRTAETDRDSSIEQTHKMSNTKISKIKKNKSPTKE